MTASHIDYTIRFAIDPAAAARMDTDALRANFHIGDLFRQGRISLTYSHYDRMIVGGAMPVDRPLALETIRPTGTARFLERRELIAVNIGGPGRIEMNGESFRLEPRDMAYAGMGEDVTFSSEDPAAPAKFYLLSAPAHQALPRRHIRIGDAKRLDLGSAATSNERSIFQFIHPEGVKTCQLVVGMTQLAPGSVWNTMPCHVTTGEWRPISISTSMTAPASCTHGRTERNRHIVMAREEAVLSPPWSIHSGCGTANYAFIWAMAGDNVDYTDVEMVPMETMR